MAGLMRRLPVLGIGAAAGFLAGLAFHSIPAQAIVNCTNWHAQWFNPNADGRGVKVSSPGMRVSNTSVDCTRRSIVYVVSASGNKAVLVGWYETEVHDFNCPSTTGPPRVLRAKLVQGTYTCDQSTQTYSQLPTDDAFSVSDDNQDGIWEYRRNGNLIGTYDLGGFTSGAPGADTGRYSGSGDSMYGNFDGLKKMGQAATWNDWADNTGYGSDPDYVSCVHSHTWGEVKQGLCP